MASGWAPKNLNQNQVADGEAYHCALYHQGDIHRPAKWHEESVSHLLELAMGGIRDGSVVVDYGSGTGGSAIELLKITDDLGISIDLVLIDPLESWFGKAWEILCHRDDVHFEISTAIDSGGNVIFRDLEEMLGPRKADVIISSSTLHLVPLKALENLAKQFARCLAHGGVVVWNSGDVECDWREENVARLHDPYRAIREHIRNHDSRLEILDSMESEIATKAERRIDRIFPEPFSISDMIPRIESAGFSTELSDKVVDFHEQDAERFILVPRLAGIAAPLLAGDLRDSVIRDALAIVMERMREKGSCFEGGYRSHWVYGLHRLT